MIYKYRSDSWTRARRAESSLDTVSRRMGRVKASSTSEWEWESRKPRSRSERTWAAAKSRFSRQSSAPKSSECRRFRFWSTSFLQHIFFSFEFDSSISLMFLWLFVFLVFGCNEEEDIQFWALVFNISRQFLALDRFKMSG